MHFLQRNQIKLPKDYLEVLEGGSLCSSPPNTGSTDKFCVCVRQNVAKQCKFLRIFDILTSTQHFVNILPTFCRHGQLSRPLPHCGDPTHCKRETECL